MKQIIYDIIKNSNYGIGINNYFDTHFIIQVLIENYSDDYFYFVSKYTGSGTADVATIAHRQISKIIKELSEGSGKILEKLPNKCVSFNIHHNPTPNALWIRLE